MVGSLLQNGTVIVGRSGLLRDVHAVSVQLVPHPLPIPGAGPVAGALDETLPGGLCPGFLHPGSLTRSLQVAITVPRGEEV